LAGEVVFGRERELDQAVDPGRASLYASATKSKLNNHPNKNTDNDFMNSLLPLINAFVSQLLQKIIDICRPSFTAYIKIQMSPRSTTLLNWNANGLKSHRNALLAFLNHHNIDIACITETHLSNTDKLNFPGYKMYRADRVTQIRAMGGVAILVRNQIIQQQMPTLNLLCLEAVAVLIRLNNRPVTLVSAYQPPSRHMHISDYEQLLSPNSSIIIAGDLNSKHTNWGCRVTNPNGRKLQSFIANTSCTVSAPSEPTYFPSDVNRLPDILDILILKSVPLNCVHEPLAELDSDHVPVKITINSSPQIYRKNDSLIKGKPDWIKFSNSVHSSLLIPKTISTTKIAEQTADHFTEVVTDAARACSNLASTNPPSFGILPPFISSLIRRKHIIRLIWQKQRNPTVKKILNKLTKEVQVALQNYRVSSYNKFLSNMHPGESNLWKETKRLLNQEINIIPPLRTDSNLVITDIDKCNVFSDILHLTFSHNHLGNLNNDSRVKLALEEHDYLVQKCIDYVTPNEVKKIIKNLPNKKAPGHDKISNLMFKKLPSKGFVLLSTLFNSLLRLGYFPVKWKIATIILIKKPGRQE